MNRRKLRNGLDFKDNSTKDDDVCPIAAIQFVSAINDRNGFLALERDVKTREFITQTFFVDSLKKTGAKFAMDFDCCSD